MAQNVPIFSVPFYRTYVQEHSEIEKLIPLKKIHELTIHPSPWGCCNVKVSKDWNSGSVEISNVNTPDEWKNHFYTICGKYFKEFVEMTYDIVYEIDNKIQITFSDSWINLYERNSFQEWHNHLSPTSMFSFCYFYKIPDDKNSAKFLFKSRLFDLESSFPHKFKTQGPIAPRESQHELFIFPSWLDHMVSPHNCDEERVTFSGNFYIS